ncbi:MAG: DUF3783 domain-containing protein [Desulfobacterales bacterium]
MSEDTFSKVSRSDSLLYGPPKLILCGFPAAAQPKLQKVLAMVGLEKIPAVWAAENQTQMTLTELLELPAGSGEGQSSSLPRTLIVSGITENQLHGLMNACRQSGMQGALWATLTPTSESWTLKYLLEHLLAERETFRQQQRPGRDA